jgi:hypothetical protein
MQQYYNRDSNNLESKMSGQPDVTEVWSSEIQLIKEGEKQ